ncbi:MAG: ABC transporter ATP-binding protein [Pseudomonadota bacterium]
MTAQITATGAAIQGRLEPCDLAFEPGTVTMLVGPNGAGKTSLLHALAGLPVATGEICIGGEEIAKFSPGRRLRYLSFLGASRAINWPLLARDYVALGLPAGAPRESVDTVLQSLDAEGFADRRLDQLSTGERSRVMIARALAPSALALLLDEPCANLDPQWQLTILERLGAEAAGGATVILSIHDLELARHYGDRIIVIDGGHIVEDGPPDVALSADNLGSVFGVARKNDHWTRV